MGTSAVAEMGMASVIHQTAIRTVTAAALIATGAMPEGVGRASIRINAAAPPIRPTVCLFNWDSSQMK
jgi:hypothetical protein